MQMQAHWTDYPPSCADSIQLLDLDGAEVDPAAETGGLAVVLQFSGSRCDVFTRELLQRGVPGGKLTRAMRASLHASACCGAPGTPALALHGLGDC